MPATKTRLPRIAIVGTGKLGSALALSLSAAGYRVTEIVSRRTKTSLQRSRALARRAGSHSVTLDEKDLSADLVWLCVPDGAIASCARSLSRMSWVGKIAMHSSGVLTSEELAPLRRRGAKIASVHPMMTFVTGVTPPLKGVGFAIEGDREAAQAARRIVRRLGGDPFLIAQKDKVLYHAWGMFASPLLTALLAASEQVAQNAGVPPGKARQWAMPIVRQTIENYAQRGAARGFSGPIIRGDAATLARHLKELRRFPEVKEIYLALARFAAQNLPTKNKSHVLKLLE